MPRKRVTSITEHFEEMRKRAEKLRRLAPGGFPENDARRAFFNNASSLITVYCASLGLVHAGSFFQGRKAPDAIVDMVVSSLFGQPLLDYYAAKLRAHLFLDVWCAFEDALRVLYEAVVPSETRAKDLEAEKARYKKPPKNLNLGIPLMWSRVASVASRAQTADSEIRRHREVVEFCAAARNTIHSNTFYRGQVRVLKLARRSIELHPGQPTNFLSIELLPRLIDELAKASAYLRKGIRQKDRIDTPAGLLDSPYGQPQFPPA